MQKIACVFSFNPSSWVSCQKIVFNLHKAYEGLPQVAIQNFNYNAELHHSEVTTLGEKIFDYNPDIIVILDHKPHPLNLLKPLLKKYERITKKPRIIFHLFGDFTLYYEEWARLETQLEGFKVDFVVASPRQKNLIDKFLPSNLSSTVCPFPVRENEFTFNETVRSETRKEWKVKDDELIFVYTGRLSRQKRIHLLINTFVEVCKNNPQKKFKLYLYGQTDHLGDNFLGKWEVEGEYFRKIHKLYSSLPLEIKNRIEFKGHLPNKELKAVYNACDYLVNLSVHNDEDFGMSVAEAQNCGLPAILSDWGGLAGFTYPEIKEASSFVPVVFSKKNKIIFPIDVISAFQEKLDRKALTNSDRKKLGQLAQNKFGLTSATEIIQRMFQGDSNTFTKFSHFFRKVIKRRMFSHTPYLTVQKTIHSIYKEIYSSYVRDN